MSLLPTSPPSNTDHPSHDDTKETDTNSDSQDVSTQLDSLHIHSGSVEATAGSSTEDVSVPSLNPSSSSSDEKSGPHVESISDSAKPGNVFDELKACKERWNQSKELFCEMGQWDKNCDDDPNLTDKTKQQRAELLAVARQLMFQSYTEFTKLKQSILKEWSKRLDAFSSGLYSLTQSATCDSKSIKNKTMNGLTVISDELQCAYQVIGSETAFLRYYKDSKPPTEIINHFTEIEGKKLNITAEYMYHCVEIPNPFPVNDVHEDLSGAIKLLKNVQDPSESMTVFVDRVRNDLKAASKTLRITANLQILLDTQAFCRTDERNLEGADY